VTSNEFRKSIDHCELCGARRSLELHHIIPTSLGGPDEEDNWIMLCVNCHSRLTPRKILQRLGIEKAKRKYTATMIDKCCGMLVDAFGDDEGLYLELMQKQAKYFYEEGEKNGAQFG
jgi:hypothetical protein